MGKLANIARRASTGRWLPIVKRTSMAHSVVLTFDDGPSPNTTLEILDILEEHQAVGTFFFSAKRAAAFPNLVEATARRGHAVYPHCDDHVRMDELTAKAFADAMTQSEACLNTLRQPPATYYVRLPYGAGHGSRIVHSRLRMWRSDCRIMHWNFSMRDWTLADDCHSIDQLTSRCEAAARAAVSSPRYEKSIVLLHEDPMDVDAPLKSHIAPILLTSLLDEMRERGLTATPLDPGFSPSLLLKFFRPSLHERASS